MEATFVSVIFMLVFWGGLFFFLGEAIILSFFKAQQLHLKQMSVFSHREYYKQTFFRKVGSIFTYSTMRTKMLLCVLICMYAVLCIELISVTDSSLLILDGMRQTIATSSH